MSGPSSSPDCVVIGAGVIGSSVALSLSRKGFRVLVVERAPSPGAGSTSASSSIIRFNYSNRDGVLAAWESMLLWERWRDVLDLSGKDEVPTFHKIGMLVVDSPDPTQRRHVLALFDEVGVPYEELDSDGLRARFPALDVGRYWPPRPVQDDSFFEAATESVEGYFSGGAGYVDDPRLAAENLATAAGRAGAEYLFGAEVVAIDRRDDRVGAVRLKDGTVVDSLVVVNAAGPHSSRVNALAGVLSDFSTITTRALREEVHVVPAPAAFRNDGSGTVVLDADLGTYFRPQPGGTLLIGGVEAPCDPLEFIDDPDSFDEHPTVAGFETHAYRVARRLPDLVVPPRPVGLAALYDVTPDWTPVYDRTSLDGYYVAIGTSGNQFKNAPVVGPFMAELIEGCENGRDHDESPVEFRCAMTGHSIDLGRFSRLRPLATDAPTSVLG